MPSFRREADGTTAAIARSFRRHWANIGIYIFITRIEKHTILVKDLSSDGDALIDRVRNSLPQQQLMHTQSKTLGGTRDRDIPRPNERLPDLLTEPDWRKVVRALRLSGRQADILRFAFYDERDEAIAMRLGCSVHTIHTHRMRLFRRLGVSSMAQAIAVTASMFARIIMSDIAVTGDGDT